MNKLKIWSSPILRIGLALVFLWFGINQIIDPTVWTAYLPEWLVSMSPISANNIVYLNGVFEIIFGTALLFGFFTRFVAFLLFLHIADITFTVGFDAIGVRDFGLTITTLAVWMNGYDFFTLDNFIHKVPSASPEPRI